MIKEPRNNNSNNLAAPTGALPRCRSLAGSDHAARPAPCTASRQHAHICPTYYFSAPKRPTLATKPVRAAHPTREWGGLGAGIRFAAYWLPLLFTGLVHAHGGEDHSHEAPPPVVSGSAPARLADGGVFLPKPVQRQLGLRTQVAAVAAHAAIVELNGRVVADPQAGGKVQATQGGRIELGARARLGARVARGEVLATLQPLVNSLERGGQQAQLADLAARSEQAQRRVARLEQLEGIVPAKEIEAARIELHGLRASRAALAGSFAAETLRAPVAGVVAAVNVVAGQVVEARETLFEIVDPARLTVEALAYDPVLAAGLGAATAAVAGGELKLMFLGAGQVLREGALPVLFRVTASPAALAVGQPVQVLASTRATRQGVAVPLQAVLRDGAGTQVWLHVGAERLVARKVKVVPLDAQSWLVTEGLSNGDRVVVNGAAALARVR